MVVWHETLLARYCLRLGGAGTLAGAWFTGSTLFAQVHAHPPRSASLGELGLCAVLVTLLLIGNALLFFGSTLFRQVEIPNRWQAALIGTREFEVLLFREDQPSADEDSRAL